MEKTIEERADKFYYDAKLEEGWCQEKCAEVGYIQGATEQKAIDIDKACEWYKSRGCYFVYSCDAIEDFRKFMEE